MTLEILFKQADIIFVKKFCVKDTMRDFMDGIEES